VLAGLLVLSAVSLGVGVALAVAGQERRFMRRVIEGFTAGAVPTLILVHVVPSLWARVGPMALVALASGYGTFWLVEHAVEHRAVRVPVALAVLTIHSALDGASLAVSQSARLGRTSSLLVAMVVAHRFPEGLLVGGLSTRRYGPAAAAAIGFALALVMAGGAAGGSVVLGRLDGHAGHVAVACGMGALLRVLFHDDDADRWRAPGAGASAAIGAILALAIPELP